MSELWGIVGQGHQGAGRMLPVGIHLALPCCLGYGHERRPTYAWHWSEACRCLHEDLGKRDSACQAVSCAGCTIQGHLIGPDMPGDCKALVPSVLKHRE